MIKPLADRVLIQPKEAETKTAAGIYIPDTAKEKPQEGEVLAVGPGKRTSLWKSRRVTLSFMANMPGQRLLSMTRNIS